MHGGGSPGRVERRHDARLRERETVPISTRVGQHLAPDGEVGNGGAGDAEGRHAGSDRSEVDLWRWGQRGGWGGVAHALLRRRCGQTCAAFAPLSRCLPGPAQLVGGGFVDAEEPASGHVGELRQRSVPQAHAEPGVAGASCHQSVDVDDFCGLGLLPLVPRHAKEQHFVPGFEHAICVAAWGVGRAELSIAGASLHGSTAVDDVGDLGLLPRAPVVLGLEHAVCVAGWLRAVGVSFQSFAAAESARCPFCSFACAREVVLVGAFGELQRGQGHVCDLLAGRQPQLHDGVA